MECALRRRGRWEAAHVGRDGWRKRRRRRRKEGMDVSGETRKAELEERKVGMKEIGEDMEGWRGGKEEPLWL